jgi:hypothetical protein
MRLTHIIYRLPTISATYDYCYCIIKGKIIHSEQHSIVESEMEEGTDTEREVIWKILFKLII